MTLDLIQVVCSDRSRCVNTFGIILQCMAMLIPMAIFVQYGSKNEDLVTRCPSCCQKFSHATYLMYHLMYIHKKEPTTFIDGIMNKSAGIFTCSKCHEKGSTPITVALHHDRHFVKTICPHSCKKSYASPADYYSNDTCKSNNMPKVSKDEVEKAILNTVEKNKFSKIIF